MTIARPEFVAERDDTWVSSTCALCYGTCSILAHRVNGVVVKVEGNPESAIGKGRLCLSGHQYRSWLSPSLRYPIATPRGNLQTGSMTYPCKR